ncbi:MAG: capsule assembly Wzi family protein, partial [Longimicrobiales bacterium]
LRIGTSRPVDLRVLDLESTIFWGSVSESDFFDAIPGNDSHLFTASTLVLQPHFLRGLYIGFARVYHDTLKALGHGPSFYLDRIIESPLYVGGGNRPGNGIGAIYFRWVLRESGFETFGEWAREDTPFDLENLLRQPDWTQAYAAGLQKVFTSPRRLTRVYAEFIHLGESAAVRAGPGFFSYYTHAIVTQGHTHRGQLLGASLGPGSDAQSIGVDVFRAKSRTGVMLEHARYDEDTYYRTFARRYGEARHDAEITAEVRRLQFVGRLSVEGVLRLSRRYDRDFISLRNEGPVQAETNWGTELWLTWRPQKSLF